VIVVLVVLLACCAGALAYTGLQVQHRDQAIAGLRVTLRATDRRAPSPALRVSSGSVFPRTSGGAFSMVAATTGPGTARAPRTWLFVYGRHVTPGGTYALVGGTCGSRDITSFAWATATADRQGDVRLTASGVAINPADPQAWVLVQSVDDGTMLGGIRGPLIGGSPQALRSQPSW
jgi:hypothetical protein